MKKILPFLLIIFFHVQVIAQVSVPNGGFENWITGNNLHPKGFSNNSNKENFFRSNLPFNLTRTTDSWHGTYAVMLQTLISGKDSAGGYMVNSPFTDGSNWHGGVPYSERPTGFRGYYKCNIAEGDSGLILAAFSKAGINIGMYFYKIGGIKTDYTLFNFPIIPALTQTPDSVIVGFTSSDLVNNIIKGGSTVTVDSVSFTGVTGQPSMLYGDFELWDTEYLYKPMSWYSDREGAAKTADSYAGSYAVELSTFAGNENNIIVARGGRISTGYYSNACNCMLGGYPYTLKKDTLVFWYKYTPVLPNDSAAVSMNFKKNGAFIFGQGIWLGPSAVYKKAEIPFDMGPGTTPDSVVIEIQSSLWNHKDIAYAGAVLKVDEINFRSQMLTTGIKRISNTVNSSISLFPNPTSGRFSVQVPDNKFVSENIRIEILNITGQKVLSSFVSRERSDFDISDLPKGLYFAKISDGENVRIIKIIKK